MPKDTIDYANIALKLELFCDWLNTRKIIIDNSRVSELLNNVKLIDKEYRNGTIPLKEKSLEEFIYTLTEAKSLINIYEQFHSKPRNFISNKLLETIIQGPFLPRDEISGDENVNPRNSLFELELAAFFEKGGIIVTSRDDITFSFNNFRYKIECKRLFSWKNFYYNINSASKQLDKKLSNNQYGIIALSLEKLLGFNEKMLITNNLNKPKEESYKLCCEFIHNNKLALDSVTNHKIIGFILVNKFISEVNEGKKELYYCFFNTLYPVCDKSISEYRALQDFASFMKV